jgi:methylated-DNA-[protein]-cysteine S-methyltransferase
MGSDQHFRDQPGTSMTKGECCSDPIYFDAVVAFPAMHVGVAVAHGQLTEIRYLPQSFSLKSPQAAVAERAVRQLERYRDDPDFVFDLPLAEIGTAFQRRVWQAMRGIERGGTRTYGELASRLGSAARAVGQACGANRFPLVIPCHRVVGAAGIGGFAHHATGFHIEVKRWLLRHERAI